MIKAIVIGTSSGGINALEYLLPHLSNAKDISVFIVQHIQAGSNTFFIEMLKSISLLNVKESSSEEEIVKNVFFN